MKISFKKINVLNMHTEKSFISIKNNSFLCFIITVLCSYRFFFSYFLLKNILNFSKNTKLFILLVLCNFTHAYILYACRTNKYNQQIKKL